VAVLPGLAPLGGRKMKRSRTEAAEARQRLVRAVADRFQREAIDAGRGPMKWNALAGQSSSLCKALSVIGDRWTLLILNQCFLRLRRYGEIRSSLGLSKPLLAARLKKMVRLGVLKKVPSRKSRRVHEYLLTEKGRQLYPVLLALIRSSQPVLRRQGGWFVVSRSSAPTTQHQPSKHGG
jgi:DNA-binding HxlR family transcriptional regulator